eukprot:TRINITY_DN3451_c0_g1_i7.p1 TRINITY_DN3451_c0_g1~~TRINITY_DN3451_c0_g1_i7.p1  ORF type:complete len:126 (-),score=34.03 TRINITY_DN3451_c0_g1_i7:187-564(-)
MTPFILLSLVAIASSQPLDARIRDLADAAYQEFSGSITLPCDGETLPEDQCAYQKVDAATTYAEALQILELFRIQRIADAASKCIQELDVNVCPAQALGWQPDNVPTIKSCPLQALKLQIIFFST